MSTLPQTLWGNSGNSVEGDKLMGRRNGYYAECFRVRILELMFIFDGSVMIFVFLYSVSSEYIEYSDTTTDIISVTDSTVDRKNAKG